MSFHQDQPAACFSLPFPSSCRPFGLLGAFVLCLAWLPALLAREIRPTVCCRSSGGTRGACLSQWFHLVPVSNRFNPGEHRLIGIIQAPSIQPTSLVFQLQSITGVTLAHETLPASTGAVQLLKLPASSQFTLLLPSTMESYPSCQPNRPPTRSLLAADLTPDQITGQNMLLGLSRACGQSVETKYVIKRFNLEEMASNLPDRLIVNCYSLRLAH